MNQNYELLIVDREDTKTLFPLERVFFFLLQRVGRFVLKKSALAIVLLKEGH
jgi:hypothetical protein